MLWLRVVHPVLQKAGVMVPEFAVNPLGFGEVPVKVLAACLEWLMGFMLFTIGISPNLHEISIMGVTHSKKRTVFLSDGNKKGEEMRHQANWKVFLTDK